MSANPKTGDVPQYGQLSQGSMQPHSDYIRSLAARFSGETNVPLSSLGVVSDNPSSAEAIYAAKEDMVIDAQNLNGDNGDAMRNDALRSVNQTVIANCGRDRREGVRFARVSTGLETCTFCLMLASRGAVYHTRESAGEFSHYHRRCDCKVVPGFADDPMAELVEGHSPREAQRQWQELERIDGIEDIAAFEKEMLKSRAVGKLGVSTKDEFASPLPKEERVVKWLIEYGIDVHSRETRSSQKKRTSDFLIGGPSGVPWEIKQPTGNGKQTIYHQFEEAAGQSRRLILDLSELVKTSRRWNWETVIESADRYMRWHFKDSDGNSTTFLECLLIDEEKIRHIKNGS